MRVLHTCRYTYIHIRRYEMGKGRMGDGVGGWQVLYIHLYTYSYHGGRRWEKGKSRVGVMNRMGWDWMAWWGPVYGMHLWFWE
jgi:hypothetical protein